MNSRLVSVVIPMYNAAAFIEQTLDSMDAQTSPPHEVIVVDDGSTDEGRAIVSRYRFSDGSAPRIIVHSQPLGVARARNHGVAASTGPWVGLCDNDDLWHPRRIELVERHISTHPLDDAVSTDVTGFALALDREALRAHPREPMVSQWAESADARRLAEELGDDLERAELPIEYVSFGDLQRDTSFPTTAVIYRREAYLLAGGVAPLFHAADDWMLNGAIADAGDIARVRLPLVFYRVRPSSQSHDESAIARPLLMAMLSLRNTRGRLAQGPAGDVYEHFVRLGSRTEFTVRETLAFVLLGDVPLRRAARMLARRVLRAPRSARRTPPALSQEVAR